jgi:hypothetical protein
MASSLNIESVSAILSNWKTLQVSLFNASRVKQMGHQYPYCGSIMAVSSEAFFMPNTNPWGTPQQQLSVKLHESIKIASHVSSTDYPRDETSASRHS